MRPVKKFDMGYHTWDGAIVVEARASLTMARAVMTVMKSIFLGADGGCEMRHSQGEVIYRYIYDYRYT